MRSLTLVQIVTDEDSVQCLGWASSLKLEWFQPWRTSQQPKNRDASEDLWTENTQPSAPDGQVTPHSEEDLEVETPRRIVDLDQSTVLVCHGRSRCG